MPPKVESDDDALLDVMRKDGYHVKHPSFIELGATTHRVHAHVQAKQHPSDDVNVNALLDEVSQLTDHPDKPAAFLQVDKRRHQERHISAVDKDRISKAVAELRRWPGLAKRIAAGNVASDKTMLISLDKALSKHLEDSPCPDPPKSATPTAAQTLAQKGLALAKAETETVASLRKEITGLLEEASERRMELINFLDKSISGVYEAADNELQTPGASMLKRSAPTEFESLDSMLRRDAGAAHALVANLRAAAQQTGLGARLQKVQDAKENELKRWQKSVEMTNTAAEEQWIKALQVTQPDCAAALNNARMQSYIQRALKMLDVKH
jgi:hypothetical protein